MNIPPRFSFEGNKVKSESLKSQGLQFCNYVINQADLGGISYIHRNKVLADGSTISVITKKGGPYDLRTSHITITSAGSEEVIDNYYSVVHLGLNSIVASCAITDLQVSNFDGAYADLYRYPLTPPNTPINISGSYRTDSNKTAKTIWRGPQNIAGRMSEVDSTSGLIGTTEKVQAEKYSVDLGEWKAYDALYKQEVLYVVSSWYTLGRVFGYMYPTNYTTQHLKISRFTGIGGTPLEEVALLIDITLHSYDPPNNGIYITFTSGEASNTIMLPSPGPTPGYGIFGVIDAKFSEDAKRCSLLLRAETGLQDVTADPYVSNTKLGTISAVTTEPIDTFDIVVTFDDGFFGVSTLDPTVTTEGTYDNASLPGIVINSFRVESLYYLTKEECLHTNVKYKNENIVDYSAPMIARHRDNYANTYTFTYRYVWPASRHEVVNTFTYEIKGGQKEYIGYKYVGNSRSFVTATFADFSGAVPTIIPAGSSKRVVYTTTGDTYKANFDPHISTYYTLPYPPPGGAGMWRLYAADIDNWFSALAGEYTSPLTCTVTTSEFTVMRIVAEVDGVIIGFPQYSNGVLMVAPNSNYNRSNTFTLSIGPRVGSWIPPNIPFTLVGIPTIQPYLGQTAFTVSASKGTITYQGLQYTGAIRGIMEILHYECATYPEINAGSSIIAHETAYAPYVSGFPITDSFGTWYVGFKNYTNYTNNCMFEAISDGNYYPLSTNTTSKSVTGTVVQLSENAVISPSVRQEVYNGTIEAGTITRLNNRHHAGWLTRGSYGFINEFYGGSKLFVQYAPFNYTKFQSQYDTSHGQNKVTVLSNNSITDIPTLSGSIDLNAGKLRAGYGIL